MTDELLDASLRKQLRSTEDGENALILPSKKAKKHKKQRETETRRHAQMQLSKSKLKKLAKKEERRIKKTKRGELIANLRTHSATQEQLKLMKGVGTVGSAMTRRQLMHRALLRERAGIATEEDTGLLYRPRRGMRGGAMALDEEDAEEEEDSEDEEVGEEEAKGGEKAEVKGLKVEMNHGNSAAHKQIPHTSVVTEKRADALKSGPKATESVAKVPKVASLSDARKRGVEGARAVFVNVDRPMEVQKARMALPVCRSEQEVMEAVASHDVVVLCSETGSGKTTQVPQFLYEAGYGRSKSGRPGVVGVTQPRRVAATAMAARVAHELGQVCGGDEGEVAYQVRYDRSTVTSRTVIKFMTDGVLLRELQSDVLLRGYSAILLDEVHERGLNTDLLLGALSRVVTLRRQLAAEHGTLSAGKRGRPGAPQMQPGAASGPGGLALTRADGALASDRRGRAWAPYPLKVIIMSATLRTDELTQNPRLFHPPPPVVRIGSRQHPVTIHFSKRTEMEEYVNKAIRKTATIHKRLPPGGILVFLTGRQEIDYAVAELRRRLRVRKSRRTAPLPAPTSGNEPNPEKITTEDELRRESVAGLALDAEDEADLDATAISDAAEADGSPKVGNVPTHGNGGSDDDVDEDGVDDDDDDDENVQILRNGDGQLGAIEHQRKDDSGFPDGEEDDDDENEWGSSSGPDSKTTAVAEAAAAWAVREDPGSDPFSGLNIDYGDAAAAAAVRGKNGVFAHGWTCAQQSSGSGAEHPDDDCR